MLSGLKASSIWGFAIAGVTLTVLSSCRSLLPRLPEDLVHPPYWSGLGLMIGAAIREEILFRLGALSFVTWIATKFTRRRPPFTFEFWLGNLIVAIAFAIVHALSAAPLLNLSTGANVIVLVLVGVASASLGWIYWRYGLVAAICAHMIAGTVMYSGIRLALAW